ncbi:hypothetical protein SAICODRAFT_30177 [Saitoella complicata NRRL Y-17804]|uniref:uncharacterized protein n=1 Tax=Saitoella complicata (strain BCRC 22490 / CBS 7301 / JCM 7358 / NBRC 10748 / NRRL Y-17804) TaxID=698492 RepID=UPI000867E48E|nr:uncharacterized protein SAICODRAFT_30177 [Saitoella complicata NRRL Y-17804]ODQ53501.1 hypothetical protein SAICODRAFT_30177 [Saitoella complicata NRRL Y-17804]
MLSSAPSGFRNAPISKFLSTYLITTSTLIPLLSLQPLLHIQFSPHLLQYHQFHRLLTWQLAYVNSGEVLFAVLLVYNLRGVERAMGSRKYISLIISTWFLTSLLGPLLLLLLRPIFGLNYLPPGPTPLLFSLLAHYASLIPPTYSFHLEPLPRALTVTDKIFVWGLAAQVALSQGWGSAVSAAVGWCVGLGWRAEVVPGRVRAWRVPSSFLPKSLTGRGPMPSPSGYSSLATADPDTAPQTSDSLDDLNPPPNSPTLQPISTELLDTLSGRRETQRAPRIREVDIETLMGVFPELVREEAVDVLERNGGEVERAVGEVLGRGRR